MVKIIWQSRAPVVYEAVQSGHLPDGANGGNAYDYFAAMALKEEFDFSMDEAAVLKKKDSFHSYWWRMAHHPVKCDVLIREPSPIVFGRRNGKVKTVGMIHHIDDALANSSLKHKWFFNRLKKKLVEDVDLVVTVSKYWRDYLQNLGCKKIKVIYNAFDPGDYSVSEEKVKAFKEKYGFQKKIPLVYLGNAHRQKGVYEAYRALKDHNFQFVMTGAKNHAPDLPVKFLSLDKSDYSALLKSSDVVITMSRMAEGWNRIAHEALLSQTPVIGSGTGGMMELLQGGGQLAVADPANLAAAVERVLKNRKQFADSGFNYVKRFDKKYFNTEWQNTIRELAAG